MIGSLSASTRQANNMARYPGLMGIPQDQGMLEGAHKAVTGELLQSAVRLRCESSYQTGSGLAKQAGKQFSILFLSNQVKENSFC